MATMQSLYIVARAVLYSFALIHVRRTKNRACNSTGRQRPKIRAVRVHLFRW